MAYIQRDVPQDYSADWLREELEAIRLGMQDIDVTYLNLTALHVEPSKVYLGLVVLADGSDWNPGAG
ncbi:hypothetical protein KA005_66195, partial [bacterium]|nr:hypothetical protein [bacterium]